MGAEDIGTDPVLNTAGQKSGLEIWRIENFKLKPVPKSQHGCFYEGDAYIILQTKAIKVRNGEQQFSWNLHFWLGESSSQDEQGTAAMYAVGLDESLGGDPVQYREVQGNESDLFRSYFKSGVIYQKGGISSGFKHVKTNDFSSIQRLLHVKGKRSVQAREVEFSWKSFNLGDSFIIDLGNLIVVYNALKANIQEKIKANELAKDIRDRERAGRAQLEIFDASKSIQDSASSEQITKMEAVFGEKMPSEFPEGESDEKVVANEKVKSCRLFNVSDASGEVVVKEVNAKPLKQSLLKHEDSYILDQGAGNKIWVWKGKSASKRERSQAMSYAMQYCEKREYPKSCPIELMADEAESSMFKQLFKSWSSKNDQVGLGKKWSYNKTLAKQSHAKFDATLLHAEPKQAAEQRMPDNGSGEIKIWRVESSSMKEVEKTSYGQFYSGDSYLLLYTYDKGGKSAHIIYIWQGLKSPADERAASAFLAVGMDDHFGGEPVQIRVEQGHEPRHFLEIFKGKFVIFEGGFNSQTKEKEVVDEVRLFHVKGNTTYNTKAVQVPANASRLNSSDCFILLHPGSIMVWCGHGSNGDEREMAKSMGLQLQNSTDYVVIAENHETNEFWTLLGGKTEYQTTIDKDQADLSEYDGRLFEASNASGKFTVEEIINFQQSDLDSTDVMLLDAWECIFMWVGVDANEEEKKLSVQAAADYLASHPADRSASTPLVTVKQGYEPFHFVGWFQAWDPEFWGEVHWDEYVASGVVTGKGIKLDYESLEKAQKNKKARKNQGRYYSYEELTVAVEDLPEDVDMYQKEMYLSPADFSKTFSMKKQEFNRLKAWKQESLKKQVHLF